MTNGISVIICCYNSEKRLPETLKHIALQQVDDAISWEVLVINNNSSDNTREVAIQEWNTYQTPDLRFEVIDEPKPGLNHAREKGISESKYKYVIFCDDDNWLAENYVQDAYNILHSNNRIAVLGGHGEPVFESAIPPHFWKNQYDALAVGPQSLHEGNITDSRGVVYGAGMVLNKEAYFTLKEKHHFRFLTTDRNGSSLISGGDFELCIAFRNAGYQIWYSGKLRFRHYIPSNRTEIGYYKKLFEAFGRTDYLLLSYQCCRVPESIRHHWAYLMLQKIKNNLLVRPAEIMLAIVHPRSYGRIRSYYYLYTTLGFLKGLMSDRKLHKVRISESPFLNYIQNR